MNIAPSAKISLTGHTCGEACWEALEEICRCSCGGRNHGILRNGGEKPKRTCKIKYRWYELKAIGTWLEIRKMAYAMNKAAGEAAGRFFVEVAIDKTPTASQRKWLELAPYKEQRDVSLLWIQCKSPLEEASQ